MWSTMFPRGQNNIKVVPYQAPMDSQAHAFQQQILHMKEKKKKHQNRSKNVYTIKIPRQVQTSSFLQNVAVFF